MESSKFQKYNIQEKIFINQLKSKIKKLKV